MLRNKKNISGRLILSVENLESRRLMAVVGDVTGDGIFDTTDVIQFFQSGKYESGQFATWSEGDWNLDGRFTSDDILFAMPNFEQRIVSRIVGGSPAEEETWPATVSLQQNGNHFCGGTLIEPDVVLTAAHCVGNSIRNIQVASGRYDLSTDEGQVTNVIAKSVHDRYSSITLDSDIALLRLENAVDAAIADFATPADAQRFAPGVESAVVGWGRLSSVGPLPDKLHEVYVPIVSNRVANAPQSYDGRVTANMLAAGISTGGVDSCQGDSGGPLLVPDGSGGHMVAGIVSWGQGCARPNKYGIYTRVANFADWIDETLTEWGIVDPSTNQVPVGQLEGVDRFNRLVGWAVDMDTPHESIGVHIYEVKDGEYIYAGNIEASAERPIPNAPHGATGRHGFVWDIPPAFFDGQSHRFVAFGIDSAGGPNTQLPSPTSFRWRNQQPEGWLEGLDNSNRILGWAMDPDASSHSIDVHIYEVTNGMREFAGHATTAVDRPDVNQQFNIAGRHGFVWDVPSRYFDGQTHVFAVYAIDTSGGHNPELQGSPVAFRGISDAPQRFIRSGLVSLMTENEHFLVAEGGGGREVRANRSVPGPWEMFRVIDLGNNQVALQAHNGQYLSAEGGGGGAVYARAPWIREWETFDVVGVGSQVALRAMNGQYLSAENGGGGEVYARAPWTREWELFSFTAHPDPTVSEFVGANRVSLRSHNGHYVVAEGGGGRELLVNRPQVGSWEKFTVIHLGDARVALRASNGQYVTAEGGGGGMLYARASWIREWETFEVVGVGEGQVALRAHHGQFLSAENGGGGILQAVSPWAREWETFHFEIF